MSIEIWDRRETWHMEGKRTTGKILRGLGIIWLCMMAVAVVCFVVFGQLVERGWQNPLGSWKAKNVICDYVEARYPDRAYDCTFPISSIKYNGRFAAQVEFPEEGATIVVTYWEKDSSLDEQALSGYPMTRARYAEELSYPMMGIQQSEQDELCPVMVAVDGVTREQMIDSLQEDMLYAYPMMWDQDGDGAYEQLTTWPQWQSAKAEYWEVGLLTKEEFINAVQDYEHWREIAMKR